MLLRTSGPTTSDRASPRVPAPLSGDPSEPRKHRFFPFENGTILRAMVFYGGVSGISVLLYHSYILNPTTPRIDILIFLQVRPKGSTAAAGSKERGVQFVVADVPVKEKFDPHTEFEIWHADHAFMAALASSFVRHQYTFDGPVGGNSGFGKSKLRWEGVPCRETRRGVVGCCSMLRVLPFGEGNVLKA